MRDSELTDDFTTARLLSYLIGEFQITNRRQRRFLPEAARSEKEAVSDNIVKNARILPTSPL